MDGRPTCYKCFRPATHCVCGLIAPFTAHCGILILQHPNEQRKFYSTAKLVAQGVTNCRILRGVEFEPGVIEEAIAGQEPYLLFPSADAVSCETVPLKPNSTVIVIDGTWSEAKKIVFRNPVLRTLPAISFSQPLRSNYRIRKQPRDHCLSTIESIAHLLKLNAASQGKGDSVAQYESLLQGFEKMVDIQIKYFPRFSGVSSGRRRMRPRGKAREVVPEPLCVSNPKPAN